MKTGAIKPDINEVGAAITGILAVLLLVLYFWPIPSYPNQQLREILKDCDRIEITKNPPQGSMSDRSETHVRTLKGQSATEFTQIMAIDKSLFGSTQMTIGPSADYSLRCYRGQELKCTIGYASSGQISCDKVNLFRNKFHSHRGFFSLAPKARLYLRNELHSR
jgi:hypothetical protein